MHRYVPLLYEPQCRERIPLRGLCHSTSAQAGGFPEYLCIYSEEGSIEGHASVIIIEYQG